MTGHFYIWYFKFFLLHFQNFVLKKSPIHRELSSFAAILYNKNNYKKLSFIIISFKKNDSHPPICHFLSISLNIKYKKPPSHMSFFKQLIKNKK